MNGSMFARFVLAATVIAGVCSCVTSPPDAFYTLEQGEIKTHLDATTRSRVEIVSVKVPELVDRPQMVVGAGSNRVLISENHRWAEPLTSAIPRLLAGQMGHELPASRIWTSLQPLGGDADYRVMVQFTRMDAEMDQGVIVEAVWSIRVVASGSVTTHQALFRATAAPGYEGIASAYSKVLDDLAANIARDLHSLQAGAVQ